MLFVRASVGGVVREATIAAALTALIILLFLGSWRSTLIVCLSIPKPFKSFQNWLAGAF